MEYNRYYNTLLLFCLRSHSVKDLDPTLDLNPQHQPQLCFFFLIKNIENIDKNNEVWASQQVVKKKASILQILMVELHGYFEEH